VGLYYSKRTIDDAFGINMNLAGDVAGGVKAMAPLFVVH
jgi:hypothetical protein